MLTCISRNLNFYCKFLLLLLFLFYPIDVMGMHKVASMLLMKGAAVAPGSRMRGNGALHWAIMADANSQVMIDITFSVDYMLYISE